MNSIQVIQILQSQEKEEKKIIVKSSNKEKKKNINSVKPKKPLSSFLYYCQEVRETVKMKYPSLNVTDTTKMIADMWNKLNPLEKLKYEEMAKKDRERYERDKERYEKENKEKENKKKESNKRTLEYSDDFINEILKKSKNEKSMKQSTSKASSKDLLYLSKLTKDEIKVEISQQGGYFRSNDKKDILILRYLILQKSQNIAKKFLATKIKNEIQEICSDLNIGKTGSKEELIEKILDELKKH